MTVGNVRFILQLTKIYTCILGENPRSVVLDCAHMANIDFTVIQGIAGLIADFRLKDVRFVLANMQVDVF